jgi:hypothetical protein
MLKMPAKKHTRIHNEIDKEDTYPELNKIVATVADSNKYIASDRRNIYFFVFQKNETAASSKVNIAKQTAGVLITTNPEALGLIEK